MVSCLGGLRTRSNTCTAFDPETLSYARPPQSTWLSSQQSNTGSVISDEVKHGFKQAKVYASCEDVPEFCTSRDARCLHPIEDSLAGKHVLITGATGFIGKVIVEKLLRSVPGIGGVWLLVRGQGQHSAAQRVAQALQLELFGPLRKALGQAAFDDLVRSRVHVVEGDTSAADLGMQAPDLELLRGSVHHIIHCAANTTFDERLDTAVAVNTLGAQAVAAFAASCTHLEALVHMSTAFVNGQRIGTAYEVPFGPSHSIAAELRGGPGTAAALDVQQEVALALGCRGRSQEHARSLGLARARLHGWTDTYTFSKALGEMLVQQECSKAGVKLAILRPSIVTSCALEPLPGWLEGLKVADPLIIASAKGRSPGFAGAPGGSLDFIPADFVSNAAIAAAVATSQRAAPGSVTVYQVASSAANPCATLMLFESTRQHFAAHPMPDPSGRPIHPPPSYKLYSSGQAFLRACVDLAIARQASQLSPMRRAAFTAASKAAVAGISILMAAGVPARALGRGAVALERAQRMLAMYKYYSFYQCSFRADHTLSLWGLQHAADRQRFYFDVRSLDWLAYLRDVHIPGLRRYVLKAAPGAAGKSLN